MKRIESRFFSTLLLFLIFFASGFPQANARCSALLESAKPQFQQFNTGILTRSQAGRIVFTWGTIFDQHASLIEHATLTDDPVKEILWAGELETRNNHIEVVNETAGILIRETPSLQKKNAGVGNLRHYLEKNPDLRALFGQTPTLTRFNPSAPPESLHLFPNLKSLALFRHDLLNVFGNMITLNEMIRAGHLDEDLRALLRPELKKSADHALGMIELAEHYGFQPRSPDQSSALKIKTALQEVQAEGLSRDDSINLKRFGIISSHYRLFSEGGGQIQSLEIESPRLNLN